MGGWLNDNHINLAQELLKRQFKNLSGFQSTLLLTKLKEPLPSTGAVQVLHSRGNHWIVASTVGCYIFRIDAHHLFVQHNLKDIIYTSCFISITILL